MNKRALSLLILLILISGIFCLILIYCLHNSSVPEYSPKNISRYRQHPGLRHEIRGFKFNSVQEGKRNISIKADRFSIGKKKLGFLSFGLMNEAKFENAVIHIYGRSKPKAGDRVSESRDNGLTFKNVFSKDALPSFQTKKISSVVMEPVSVVLHDEQTSVTRISADSAILDLSHSCILFKGNVRVVSGDSILTTSRLNLFPEGAAIRCDRHFILKTPEKEFEGKRLVSDIFLNPASSIKTGQRF